MIILYITLSFEKRKFGTMIFQILHTWREIQNLNGIAFFCLPGGSLFLMFKPGVGGGGTSY